MSCFRASALPAPAAPTLFALSHENAASPRKQELFSLIQSCCQYKGVSLSLSNQNSLPKLCTIFDENLNFEFKFQKQARALSCSVESRGEKIGRKTQRMCDGPAQAERPSSMSALCIIIITHPLSPSAPCEAKSQRDLFSSIPFSARGIIITFVFLVETRRFQLLIVVHLGIFQLARQLAIQLEHHHLICPFGRKKFSRLCMTIESWLWCS